MSHTIRNKASLLARVRRIRGQVEALERALEAEKGCAEVVQQIAAVRGAMSGLMTEVIEDHVQTHTASPSITRNADRAQRRRRTYRGRSRLSEVAARSTTQQDHLSSPDLAEQALRRTAVPAAHGHPHEHDADHHDDGHGEGHD